MNIESLLARMSEGEKAEAARILSRQGFGGGSAPHRLPLASILMEASKELAKEYSFLITLEDPWATIDPNDPPEEFAAFIEGEYSVPPGCGCCSWETRNVEQGLTFDIEKDGKGGWTASAPFWMYHHAHSDEMQATLLSYTYDPKRKP